MFTWKRYVYEIYKEKSFSKAAQNLFISQPSLSARIRKIERQIGAPLFDRSTSPLHLTELGEMYIKDAEEIFQMEQQIENYVNDMNRLKSGHLSIGGSNLFSAYVLPPLILRFRQRYPDVDIQLTEGNTSHLETLLRNNTLDMVIDNHHYDSALYDKAFCCKDNILLAVPRQFPIHGQLTEYQLSYEDIQSQKYLMREYPSVPLSMFRDLPFIMLTPGNDTRSRGDRLCRAAGFRPKIVLELGQQSTCYMAASTQLGAAFISDILAVRLPSFENLVYYKLDGEASRRTVYFYYKKHNYKTRAMEEFIAAMQQSERLT